MNFLHHLDPITYIIQINRNATLKLKTDNYITQTLYNQTQRPQFKIVLTIQNTDGYVVGIPSSQVLQNIYLACDAGYPAASSKGRQQQIFAKFSWSITQQKYILDWSGAIITPIEGGQINFKLVQLLPRLTQENNQQYEEQYEDIPYENGKYFNFTVLIQQQLLE